MQFDLLAPPSPSLARMRQLKSRYAGNSILRMMEYEALSKIELTGRIVDMGGGRNSRYVPHLPEGLEIRSVNIDPEIDPTDLVQPGDPLPFEDDSFDGAICLNTLEHIYDAYAVVAGLYRVLKPGAALHIAVPFMFRIHGHPDDYSRHTPSWWRETHERIGFSALSILPLVWGRSSTASVVPGRGGAFRGLRTDMAMVWDVLTARALIGGDTLSGKRGERICNISPGWFMTAVK